MAEQSELSFDSEGCKSKDEALPNEVVCTDIDDLRLSDDACELKDQDLPNELVYSNIADLVVSGTVDGRARLLPKTKAPDMGRSTNAVLGMPSILSTDNRSDHASCKSKLGWINPMQDYEKDLVVLNVYDITNFRAAALFNRVSGSAGYGAYHVGIELMNREYSYGQTQRGTGITFMRPRTNKTHRFHGSINLGKTSATPSEQVLLLKELKRAWRGTEYHALSHNCVHFAAVFASRLGVAPVPAFLNSLADLANSVVSFRFTWPSIGQFCECSPEHELHFHEVQLDDELYEERVRANSWPVTENPTRRVEQL